MNNLKFRAWDKKLQKFGTVSNIDLEFEEVTFYTDDEEGLEICQPFEDVEIMQSTGLFDKNGVEIFDGDIVNYEFCDFRPNVASYETGGKYVTGYKKAVLWKNGKFICNDYDLLHICEDIEVIGNIYENKELIENEI